MSKITLKIPEQVFTLDEQGFGRLRFELVPEVAPTPTIPETPSEPEATLPEVIIPEVLPEVAPVETVQDAEIVPEVPVEVPVTPTE